MDTLSQAMLAGMKKQKLDVTVMDDPFALCQVKGFLTTGVVSLDAVLGGGVPLRRFTEIYGYTSTGKSLIAGQILVACQRVGGVSFLADSENAAAVKVMQNIGGDTKSLLYSAPDTVEEVFKQLDAAIELKMGLDLDAPMVFVWDSVAASTSEKEKEKELGEQHYAIQAGIISEWFRKRTRDVSRANLAVVFINQAKQKMNVTFGDGDATFGGSSIGFYSSLRVKLKLRQKMKSPKTGRIVGIDVEALVVKNRLAPPFRRARLPMSFGHGVLADTAALWYLQDQKSLTQTGSYWTIDIPGKGPIKFQSSAWAGIYLENQQKIDDMVFEIAGKEDLWAPTNKPGTDLEVTDEDGE